MPTVTDDPIETEARKRPVYWFVILEHAVETGDHATAAEAQRELAGMGIRVSYGRPDTLTPDAGKGVRR